MTTRPSDESLRALNRGLWVERDLLDMLLFKLITVKLLLASDGRRFVAAGVREVEAVMDKMRTAELRRALLVERVAHDLSLAVDELTLSHLAAHAPEPYRTMFTEHRDAFAALTTEIEDVTIQNRRLASATLDHIRETMAAVVGTDEPATYSPDGRRSGAQTPPERVSRAL